VDAGSVGRDEIERADAVGGQAVPASEPTHPPAEGVADGTDVGGRAEQRRQTVLLGGRQHGAPLRAGRHPGGAGRGIDDDLVEPRRHDEHGVIGRSAHAMARRLDGDPQTAGPGEAHGGDDVVDRLGDDDHCGPLLDGDVPGRTGGVVTVVGGGQDGAGGATAEVGDCVVEGDGDEGE